MIRSNKKIVFLFCVLITLCFLSFGIACKNTSSAGTDSSSSNKIVLELSAEEVNIIVGDSVTLEASNVGETLIWSSENEDIATVKDGKVIGVSVGETIVTLRSETGIAECKVIVSQHLPEAFTATLNGEDVRLFVKDTYKLVVTGRFGTNKVSSDEYTIEWSTDDSTVATVENGVITAIGLGEANITGVVFYREDIAQVHCRVMIIPEVSMTLETESNVLSNMVSNGKIEIDCSYKIDSNITPVGDDELTFESLTPNILIVGESGNYQILGGGIAKVKVNYGEYCTNIYEFTVFNHVVETAEQFSEIAEDPSGYYLLMADIDFTDKIYPHVSEFSGLLEGNGFTVSNVTIGADIWGNSMFGNLSGEIRNIEFKNVSMSPLYGQMVGNGALLSTFFTGKISNMYFQGKMLGKSAIKTAWGTDYTTWGLRGSFLIRSSLDGVMEDCVIDASFDEGTDISLMCYSAANAVTVNNVYVYSSGTMTSNLGYYLTDNEDGFFLGDKVSVLSKAEVFSDDFWFIDENSVSLKSECAMVDVRPRISVEFYDGDKKIGEAQVKKGATISPAQLPRLVGNLLIDDYNYDFSKPVTDTLKLYPTFYRAITTAEEYLAMEKDGKYYLANDIDFSSVEYKQIAEFAGVLDGNGYAVKNITMVSQSGAAMFGTLSGTIQRVSFENIVMNTSFGMVGNAGLVAITFSGTLSDIYLGGSMLGVVAVKTSWADYTQWGMKAGVVCRTCAGGVLKNMIIDVECSDDTDIKGITGEGKPTYGIVTVIAGKNVNSMWHDDFALLDIQWVGEISIASGSVNVWPSFNTVTKGVWEIKANEMAQLIKGCTLKQAQ